MLELIFKLTPIFAFFAIGICLRGFRIATPLEGVFLTKFIFYVAMPSLVLVTISDFEMRGDRWLLPVANAVVDLACLAVAWLYTKWRNIQGVSAGNLIVGASLVNSVFMFPFIYAFYGQTGLAEALLFDFGNIVIMSTVVYSLAFSYCGERVSPWFMATRVLSSPIFISLSLALLISFFDITLPRVVYSVFQPIADMTMPCLLIALGILFTVKFKHMTIAPVGIAIRMVFGMLLGVVTAWALGFKGETFEVVVLMAAAPVGFMSVTLASLAKLDVALATSMASASVLVGMFTIPMILLLLGAI